MHARGLLPAFIGVARPSIGEDLCQCYHRRGRHCNLFAEQVHLRHPVKNDIRVNRTEFFRSNVTVTLINPLPPQNLFCDSGLWKGGGLNNK